jgi:methylglutaconyl-CoA hydratase
MSDVIEIERTGPVARVWLNRPDIRNAFNEESIAALARTFAGFADEPALRAVVLGGRGKAFCAGADLGWMRRMAAYTWDENRADAQALAEMLWTIYRCPVPVVGRIQGDCYAGGIGLAAVCDILVASEAATFCLSEARLGLLPATIAPYVIRALGEQASRRYFATAERFGAAQAHALGFVTSCARPTSSMQRSRSWSAGWSRTGRWPCARARSWCRMSVACRSTMRCAPRLPGASPTSARATRDGRACRASCRSASPIGCSTPDAQ